MSGLIDLNEVLGAKASHRYARLSASKARQVLNLIRDQDLSVARERLRHCERGAAEVVSKVVNSAVANASSNDHLDPDELYVAECWADEGPVLKRWRPRARGRASRIAKQTCHVTVIVAQLSPEELAEREARLALRGPRQARADRAARVAASQGTTDEDAVAAEETAESAAEQDTAEEIETVEVKDVEAETVEVEDVEVEDVKVEAVEAATEPAEPAAEALDEPTDSDDKPAEA